MVDKEKIYVITSTIATLIEEPPQPISIDQKKVQEVLARPVSISQSLGGLVVSSQRDQIESILGRNKINVRDLSGKQVFSESKVPTVLEFFVRAYRVQVISYGVNFLINAPCMKPTEWIRDNIIADQIAQRTGRKLVGGSALLKLESGRKIWNIKLDAIDDQTLFLDFNASEETKQLPDQDRLRAELQEQFDALLKLLTALGL